MYFWTVTCQRKIFDSENTASISEPANISKTMRDFNKNKIKINSNMTK